MNESVVKDVELVLSVLCNYTAEQLAKMWEQQLIPNRIVDGRRVADLDSAVAYVEGILAK